MELEKSEGEIFNIGDTREVTIIQLAEIIWRLMKGEGEPPLRFIPYSTFFGGKYEDVRRRIPDIRKAKEILGFAPSMELEEGLRIAIDWQTAIRGTDPVHSSPGK
jgi:UDP-glucose 4-epimerase